MYQLVHIRGSHETPVHVSAKGLDAELRRQRHLRSIHTGTMDVRDVEKITPKAKKK